MTAVEDPTTGADRANLEIRRIIDGRQALRKRDRTGPIMAGGSVELQRVVRTAQIITVTKNIKLALAVLKSSEIKVTQNFELKCAMKPLVLALGLRMIWTAMTNPDAQPDQPQAQAGEAHIAVTPRRAVVHQHRGGQPIATKYGG